MKYSMVKQFSNGAIDNIFNFIFKWVDFFKVLYEALWVFIEIWASFFLIFYNIFTYIYYLFLFIVDRGTETSAPAFRFRKASGKPQSVSKVKIPSSAGPVPAMYGAAKTVSKGAEAVASTTSGAAQKTMASLRPTSKGTKRNIFKSIGEFIFSVLDGIKRILLKPFHLIGNLIEKIKMSRYKATKEESGKGGSLIDEYLKEYENSKK